MTTTKTNYWKWGIIAALLIGIFFLGKSCGVKSVLKDVGSDTAVTSTVEVIRYKPSPYKVIEKDTMWLRGKEKIVRVPVHDTLPGVYEVRVEPADTAFIVSRFNQFVFYDTSMVASRGDTVSVKDTLYGNRIIGREISIHGKDTVITNTIVKKPPRKTVLSFTTSLVGNMANPFYGQGAGFTLKLSNEESYSASVFNIYGHRPMFMATKGWPIKLKRKRK